MCCLLLIIIETIRNNCYLCCVTFCWSVVDLAVLPSTVGPSGWLSLWQAWIKPGVLDESSWGHQVCKNYVYSVFLWKVVFSQVQVRVDAASGLVHCGVFIRAHPIGVLIMSLMLLTIHPLWLAWLTVGGVRHPRSSSSESLAQVWESTPVLFRKQGLRFARLIQGASPILGQPHFSTRNCRSRTCS